MELIETTCQSCGNTFNREKKRGRPPVNCIPCREGKATVLAFSRQETVVDGIKWIENAEPCLGCGKTFQRPVKRGRPPKKCADCVNVDEVAKAEEVTVSDEKLEELFKGDKFLLQGTPGQLPKGAEAQCPTTGKCGRIFTSNTACDDHKRWLPNGSYTCIDPATLGMEPRERRGIPVWTRPTPVEGG